MKNNFTNLDNDFVDLRRNDKLNIFSIEDILIKNIDEYKKELHHHMEELLQKEVDENDIIIKKNKNGEIMDIISVTKEKKN